ncbi:MAG: CRTAC1 family protein [Bacteroidales bacterium]|nr:CRTAC1 family protein [Bacteroidales bacterium]MCF8402425.1 CRTAC1 family protein [Bacteroidales bacterium]
MIARILKTMLIGFVCYFSISGVIAQQKSSTSDIINKIYQLEKNRDPKCYATANRLEDFMYGTPLNEDARNLKIEIQKEIIYYLKEKGTENAKKSGAGKINPEHLLPILKNITEYHNNENGDYIYTLKSGDITILKKDYDQYSSVSYGYRSLLSVEQDLLFVPESDLLSFDDDALQAANDYINLITLVTLKIADINARKANEFAISKKRLQDTWITILNESENQNTLAKVDYPQSAPNFVSNTTDNNFLVKEIIAQKIASYETYNQLTESVFLRNIQVYFARQKWPVDAEESNMLRSYYLESLIQFTNSLLQLSDQNAEESHHQIIRVADVSSALNAFLPTSTNYFEDVVFFPANSTDKITIESYDLDAFRDSGFHWQILGYALDDSEDATLKGLDPNAAEQTVEGIAQMGVLVLRLAGDESHKLGKNVLDIDDITRGFSIIQELILNYDFEAEVITTTEIASSFTTPSSKMFGFEDVTQSAGIDFEHKSSDWLNRFIRSYSLSREEGVIKLAIPPAFGGSGVACEDINNDGLLDVLLLGGFGNKLYLNTKEGTFKDITGSSGINDPNQSPETTGEVRQPIIADFNNDGLQDIFITYVNEPHKIFKNLDGSHFSEQSTNANLGGENAVAGPATAFDYNNDGLLDIYIGYFGNYVKGILPNLSRDNQNGEPNKLFKNLGDFNFEEVQFTDNVASNTGWTQALGHTDIDQDGLQDIIVGNDFGQNKYYLNQPDGNFIEVSRALKTDKPSYTMNVGITDLNGDLFPDLYISNIVVMQKDEKYVSPNETTEMKFDPDKMANIRTIEANDLFLSSAKDNKLISYQLSTNVGRGYSATGWSWDADFFDFDNDGDEDLYCLNGMNDFSVYSSENPFYFERAEKSKTIRYAQSSREKNVFFVNEGGQLIDRAAELGADLNSNARSASYFDFDNDGDLDILINNYHERATLLENKIPATNNWIKIKLIGSPEAGVNRDAIGSTLILDSENHKNIWREIHSTTGYLSVHPKEQHFGLGKDTIVSVEIRWTNGEVYSLNNLKANSVYEITYPDKLQEKTKL